LEGPGARGEHSYWQAVVDLPSGERLERKHPLDSSQAERVRAATTGRTILITHYNSKLGITETVALIEFPSLREIAEVPYATQPRDPQRRSGDLEISSDFGFGVSDDRKILAYSFDNVLLCRRIEDLNLLWTRQIEPQVYAWHVAVSGRGTHVAVAVSDRGFSYLQHKYYIGIYDGQTGEELARLPLSGTDGIALSPDGKLVAVVELALGRGGAVSPTVHIHGVLSGQRLASVVHDQIKSGRRQLLEAGCTVAFTADDKYLVTSGRATKVWKLG